MHKEEFARPLHSLRRIFEDSSLAQEVGVGTGIGAPWEPPGQPPDSPDGSSPGRATTGPKSQEDSSHQLVGSGSLIRRPLHGGEAFNPVRMMGLRGL